MGKVWMIASGKGGVGKSTIAAGLAAACAKKGMRTVLIDADIGLRSLDLMMNLQDKVMYELADCIVKRCSLEDALVQHPLFPSLYLLTGGQQVKPSDFPGKQLSKIMETLRKYYDIVLVDGSAGIGKSIRNFSDIADEFILVATPDAVCLRDTEKIASLLFERRRVHPWLVLNKYDWSLQWDGAISKPSEIAASLDVSLLGVIPYSAEAYLLLLQGKTLFENVQLAPCLRCVVERMQGMDVPFDTPKPTVRYRLKRWLNQGGKNKNEK